MRPLFLSALAVMLAPVTMASAQPADFEVYTDSQYGFNAELPLAVFTPVESSSPGIALSEIGGDAQLNVYGGPAEGLTPDALETRLENGAQIRTITYRAGGDSWFVLSGFYEPQDGLDETIFYTKVLFSADRDSFSAFEISFPAADKPRFEALVERFEDNFTRPAS